jgi:hypothetical protein
MQKVFCEGMVQYLDMKPELVERLFPQACHGIAIVPVPGLLYK